ncbi:hypothetical protein F901_02430 [Acinetobacter dispersus]|nr:hypothetical protein F901_02430 [Acinetobacter dispersus]
MSIMQKTIDFYFDFGSPASYLAFTQLCKIEQELDCKIHYKPVLLGGIFKATHNSSPMTVPAKGMYVMRDLNRYAALYEVPLIFNPYFPINTLVLMRIALGLQLYQPNDFLRFVTSVFEAIWVSSLNMGDEQVLTERIAGLGLDVSSTLSLKDNSQVKDQLKEDTSFAVQRGLFGLPTMFVNDEMFWGQDRLNFVKDAIQKGEG